MTRALRTLLVANDGFSTGHVTRTLAIARGLARTAEARRLELSMLLVTTSEADALLATEPLAVVRLPAPIRARRSGIADADRRRLARAAIDAVADSFAPDLIVVDTFPSGPHGELAGLGRRAKRALVRRAVPDAEADLMTTGLGDYDLAIVADDAGATSGLPIRTVAVPPILLDAPALSRADARAALGLPHEGRALLVTAGGGGDPDAAIAVRALAAQLARTTPDAIVLALGPLDRTTAPDRSSVRTPDRSSDRISVRTPDLAPLANVTALHPMPLARYLAAFDGAFAAAGYNTAHELAHAGVPAALFALPRPFDDQAARARRLAASGHAHAMPALDDESIAHALAWVLEAKPSASLACDGADRAAAALFDLMGVRG